MRQKKLSAVCNNRRTAFEVLLGVASARMLICVQGGTWADLNGLIVHYFTQFLLFGYTAKKSVKLTDGNIRNSEGGFPFAFGKIYQEEI